MGSKELPFLSEVFGRLRQASISESNSIPLPSTKKSAFATDFGGGRFSRGGCGGRGKGVVSKGAGPTVEGVALVSALIVMVKIIP